MERKTLKEQMFKERKGARDVNWDAGETPLALPVGLSEGASVVKMKDGSVGVIRRDSSGYHNGVDVMTQELIEALLEKLQT